MATRKMKTLAVVLAVVCIVGMAPRSADAAAIEGVAAWLLDGNANDAIDSHNGTEMNGVTYSADIPITPGNPLVGGGYPSNQSGSFDGLNDYVDITGNSALQPTPITIEAWVKPTGDIQMGATQVVNSYDSYRLGLWDNGGQNYWVYVLLRNQNNVWSGATYSPATFNAEEWHKIGFTYDGANITAYLDGQPGTPVAFTGNLSGVGSWVTIGGGPLGGNFGNYFRGSIDEVRIVDRALSSTEMLANYPNSLVPEPATMVLLGLGGVGMLIRRR